MKKSAVDGGGATNRTSIEDPSLTVPLTQGNQLSPSLSTGTLFSHAFLNEITHHHNIGYSSVYNFSIAFDIVKLGVKYVKLSES